MRGRKSLLRFYTSWQHSYLPEWRLFEMWKNIRQGTRFGDQIFESGIHLLKNAFTKKKNAYR